MWTSKNRRRYDRSKLRYPSDLTDDEWKLVEPLIPPGKPGGGKRTVIMREVVIRWVARFRQTGSVAAKPMGGKRSPLDAHKEWLEDLIGAEPDLTLEEIRGRLRGRGIRVAASSVWRFCDRHDITFKKKPARSRTGSRRRARGARESASCSENSVISREVSGRTLRQKNFCPQMLGRVPCLG